MESLMGLSVVRRHCIALGILAVFAGPCVAQSKPAAVNKPAKPPAVVLVVGDSLSAEYGLKRGTGWVALMEQRISAQKVNAVVVNASISGDTTSGGRSRLPALLAQHKPSVVVIELGGNDALRGLPLEMTRDNLTTMAQAAQKSGAKVLLAGMQVPPNYGQDYGAKFAATFASAAKDTQSSLVPFLLKGVADGPDAAKLFQADRIHPVEAAHPTILNTMWPTVKKLIP
jgi:acyl-CoA thioesterase-1